MEKIEVSEEEKMIIEELRTQEFEKKKFVTVKIIRRNGKMATIQTLLTTAFNN